MPKYDAAKIDTLSDTEKTRLIAAYLSHNEPNNVDWNAATSLAQSASKDSYKKMLNTALKKLVSDAGDDYVASTTSNSVPVPKRGRKRSAPVDEGEEVGSEGKKKKATKPHPKKATKTAKKKAKDEEAV